MSKVKIAGVKRGTQYSPNHVGNDGLIFSLTAQALRERGYDVREYTEAEFVLLDVEEDVIFNMARDKTTITKLKKFQSEGRLVINSAEGIENCTRAKMTKLLMDNDIPHPRSLIVPTDAVLNGQLQDMKVKAVWIKRGDFHAIHREDVTFARSTEEVNDVLREFKLRGIPNAVINEHLEGDLVKFYGVANTDFFYKFYPFDLSHSKFGHEAINGSAKQFPFSQEELKSVCDKAGEILGIDVYGGDCVVASDGSFKIIDFNDWPSFAPCRDNAGKKIAECIDFLIQHKK